ncbi:MAG: UDP-N-acetylmuramoyl-L-alanyl-D-glutamate--2,6-diaminopimelate ligase [Pseudomonadota bacterium]
MKFSTLIDACACLWESGQVPHWNRGVDPEITSVHSRSQNVGPGGLFIAVKGFKSDGHDFIPDALQRGAAALVTLEPVTDAGNIPVVRVPDIRKAMSAIAARFYGNPSKGLCLVGITGTNGKTTTSWILESIFQEAGYRTGVIGTVNWRYGGRTFTNPVTTPDAMDLQRMLGEMKANQVSHVVMEVSSHGIDLHRVNDCCFDAAVFTNLTQDHLDYHPDMDHYFGCKKQLFTRILTQGPKAGTAASVINVDHEKGRELAGAITSRLITVSQGPGAQVSCRNVKDEISGLGGTLVVADKAQPFQSHLTGGFNLENILCAAGAAHAVGISLISIVKGIEGCTGVPGRLERVAPLSGRHIFVDYAHTPDALESILATLKMRAPARLISVFGCGGDRDRTKRPIMGKTGAWYSDLAIITSDNPRTEDPLAIIDQIKAGVITVPGREYSARELDKGFSAKGFLVEPDRKKALETAVRVSMQGDIIVAAGKGHETYQILKTGTIEFDDRRVLETAALACIPKETIYG